MSNFVCGGCESEAVKKHGRDNKTGKQRYRCSNCGKTFTEKYTYRACDPKVKEDIVLSIIRGAGVRHTARMLGVSKDSVSKVNKI